MGFARVGSITGSNDKTSLATLGSAATTPVGAAATAGRVIVVFIGKDNSTTTGADNSEVTGVALRDSGDTTTKLALTKLKERTCSGTVPSTTTSSLWWGLLPVGVAATDFIKATLSAATAAKTLAGEIFSIGSGSTVAADPVTNADQRTAQVLASLSITPTNTSGPATNGRLVIRGTCVENNVQAWVTPTSGWTNFTDDLITTGGSSITNVASRAEYKIGAGNVATDVYSSLPSSAIATDSSSVMGALYEIPAPFTSQQKAYRFYQPGTEGNQNPLGAQDAAIYFEPVGWAYGHINLRVMVQATTGGDGAATDDYKLQCSKNGAAWADVTTTSANVRAYDSAYHMEGVVTSNKLTGGSGTFLAGKISEDGTADDVLITGNNFTELLYCIMTVNADVAVGNTLDFRVVRNGVALDSYAGTPRIIISAGSTGKMKVWNGSAWVEKPVKVWNGSAWVAKPLKVWNGSAWVLA